MRGGGWMESGQYSESQSFRVQGCGSGLHRRGRTAVRVMPQTKVTAISAPLLMRGEGV